jgi:hypothetical protein
MPGRSRPVIPGRPSRVPESAAASYLCRGVLRALAKEHRYPWFHQRDRSVLSRWGSRGDLAGQGREGHAGSSIAVTSLSVRLIPCPPDTVLFEFCGS